MTPVHDKIRPNTYLFLRLPTDSLKLIECKPNTIIDVGKLGSFPANLLIGRPYYYTYELLEKRQDETFSRLQIVAASELNADIVAEDAANADSRSGTNTPGVVEGDAADVTAEMKNNRLTIDDASRQALSHLDIEELKKTAAGKEIIDKILAGHAGLDEKTAYSKAKYMVRKRQKYLKRVVALPMDMGNLIVYILEKEPQRIMDIREECLGLITAWSNVHVAGSEEFTRDAAGNAVGGGRHLVIDDTGGLVVAALAERLNILYPSENDAHPNGTTNGNAEDKPGPIHRDFPVPLSTNTITIIHPAVQPNVSILKYFGYDQNIPDSTHAIHSHLKPISWLQLLHPEEDSTYREPPTATEAEMQTWKAGKRGAYWRKRRRWQRCKTIVDETREGGFESLIIASHMDPVTVLPHTIPLVRGGGHVVIYSNTIEPLVKVMDLYSKDRRTAYIQHIAKGETPDAHDFPVDPRLLLAPTLQTSRAREWQVLPGRTHPLMTSKGGAEGFIFTARRVMPLEGGVEARGNFSSKRRKVDDTVSAV